MAGLDVAQVIATVLLDPARHIGKIYELTGPESQDLHAIAAEYGKALGRQVTYVDVPIEAWAEELRGRHLPEHVLKHLLTMGHLHAANAYDRLSPDVENILGRPAQSLEATVSQHRKMFGAG